MSKFRTLARIVGISDDSAYCIFYTLGSGAALRIPLEYFDSKATIGFRFYARLDTSKHDTWLHNHYEEFDPSDFEIDHDQRVPSIDDLMKKYK